MRTSSTRCWTRRHGPKNHNARGHLAIPIRRADKQRPVLVLSRQVALDHLHTALIAPITTAIRGLPSEVRLTVNDGVTQECVANLDHILSVRQSDLRKYVGHLDEPRMREVCRAAGIALGCI